VRAGAGLAAEELRARPGTVIQYGSRISLADQGNLDVAGESGAFVEPS